MNLVGDENTDEYIATAVQIFQYCGADRGNTLRVEDLMVKFAPFIKTNKAEYSYLRSLLDPDQSNPEITVSILANILNKYSESQKIKMDLDESFNLRNGQAPHDSDSGISTDGFQLLEELQSELREKAHMAQQLRTQLDYSDRHHEEALATITAERDSLRAHLNMLREENMTLTHVRRDYEEVCERLCSSERALEDSRRDLDSARRRNKVLTEQVSVLEVEKLTLQELLSKSKDECHRINDMYASRQSSLLQENETLRTEHADLSAKLQDQEEYMRQIVRDKVLLEMELKDVLNKSNQTQLHLERSIDVSYTEDQMLSALDSLNADTRFTHENRLLDDESFTKALKEDQGRPTNLSLFDEIRLSFCNMSRPNLTDLNCTQNSKNISGIHFDNSTVGTQTDEFSVEKEKYAFKHCNWHLDCDIVDVASETEEKPLLEKHNRDKEDAPFKSEHILPFANHKPKNSLSVQGSNKYYNELNTLNKENQKTLMINKSTNTSTTVLEVFKDIEVMNFGTQTETTEIEVCLNNNTIETCIECTKCVECDRLKKYVDILENKVNSSNITIADIEETLDHYENKFVILSESNNESKEQYDSLKAIIDNIKANLNVIQGACATQEDRIKELYCDTCCAEIQTESEQSSVSTQAEVPCVDCVKRNASRRSLKRYFWEPLKSLFQLFALVCFMCAVWLLCGVARRGRSCHDTPWRWLHAHDVLDLLLTVERAPDVPM